jgi:hypothetical protein
VLFTVTDGNGNVASATVALEVVIPTYSIGVSETGLPTGTEWWVNLTNGQSYSTTSTKISFSEPNGTYVYTVATANKTYGAAGGSFAVDGKAQSRTVKFTLVTYRVTFNESGLPSGTEWWVNLTNGQTFNSTESSTSFFESNGTYDYSLATSDKEYSAKGGTITVEGAKVSKSVKFALMTYKVTLTESGLLSGIDWWVNLTNGQSFSSTKASISFTEPNGTYDYSLASADKNYTAPAGSLVVNGEQVLVKVKFTDPKDVLAEFNFVAIEAARLQWRPR